MPKQCREHYEEIKKELVENGYKVISENEKYITMRPKEPGAHSNPQTDTIIFPRICPMPPDYSDIIRRKIELRNLRIK